MDTPPQSVISTDSEGSRGAGDRGGVERSLECVLCDADTSCSPRTCACRVALLPYVHRATSRYVTGFGVEPTGDAVSGREGGENSLSQHGGASVLGVSPLALSRPPQAGFFALGRDDKQPQHPAADSVSAARRESRNTCRTRGSCAPGKNWELSMAGVETSRRCKIGDQVCSTGQGSCLGCTRTMAS